MEPLNILVADDELGVRELLYDVLTMHGHNVTCVENGTHALCVLSCCSIDVVYLDLRMPNGDGVSTLKLIRERHPSVPVIIITGSGIGELIDQTMELGAAACLPKPFSISDVIGMLDVVNPAA